MSFHSVIMHYCCPVIAHLKKSRQKAQSSCSGYIITKDNGRTIKAYNTFGDFLDSDKSWESYKKILYDPYPEMKAVHDKQLSWGSIDSLKFPEEVKNYRKEDWEKYFTQYDDKTLNVLYDSVIAKENKILMPLNNNPVDLCLFLPYGGCFVIPDQDKSIIYISLLINPNDAQKIIVHEYAHNLHMTGSSVKWCFANESVIKDSIKPNLMIIQCVALKSILLMEPLLLLQHDLLRKQDTLQVIGLS